MDGILALIIVFWIVSAFSKALNPKKRAKQAEKNRTAKHTGGRADKPSAAPAEHEAAPAEQQIAGQTSFMMPPLEPRPTSVGSLGTSSDEGKDICDPTLGHDGRRPAAYAGSLGAGSTEGKDTCDPLLGHGRRPTTRGDGRETPSGERRERSAKRRPSPPGEDAYALDEGIMSELDAQTLIQGVVMSEILKRPNERKWGWR